MLHGPAETYNQNSRSMQRTANAMGGTSVAEDYMTQMFDFAASFTGEEQLDSEARRLMTLRNLAMSKASKARKKKKKQRTEPQERKMTEAERRSREQARIREEREARSARSAENRRQAGIGESELNVPIPEPENKQKNKPEKASRKTAVPPLAEGVEIDIDIPTEQKPDTSKQSEVRSKKKRKTKQQPSDPKTQATTASRYAKSSAPAHPNRITASSAVTLGILTGILIGTVIYGRVQTNEVYTKIAELQAEYDDLNARNISLKSEMEGKMTVKKIEDYAEDVLGLRPLNQSQIEYIQLQTEDTVTVSEPEDNFFVTVNDYLVSFWEFLRGK